MGDPYLYTHPSPLDGYEDLEPLPQYADLHPPTSTVMLTQMKSEFAADGKSIINPPAKFQSPAYTKFVHPISNGERGGFDIHIYYLQTSEYEMNYAKHLHERIRRECTSSLPPSATHA
jgi:hypothetical protein